MKICGVNGCYTKTVNGKSLALQEWVSEVRPLEGYGEDGIMRVTVGYDDKCGNGHPYFYITAEVRTAESRRQKDIAAGGCLHEDIAVVFPELAHLIPWHLASPKPMHYIANTVYHASNCDHHGKAKGEPCAWETYIVFKGSSVPHREPSRGFGEWLLENKGKVFDVVRIQRGEHTWWTISADEENFRNGLLFETEYETDLWVTALNNKVPFSLEKIPTEFSKGKERNLAAARATAYWPEATDEQLCLPEKELTELLKARLPQLVEKLEAMVKSLGFVTEVEDASI